MIDLFKGKHAYLSSFAPAIMWDKEGNFSYPTLEHNYQALKTRNLMERKRIAQLPTPGQAKRAGQKLVLREDWEQIKLQVMENLVREKFTIPIYRRLLIETGNEELVEGNYWGDTFWGVCRGKGENHLGKILMRIRSEIKEGL